MTRWEPFAAERLYEAALALFAERGYEHTTVADIADRAGLAKSSFFRHFADKREVLFGNTTLEVLVADAVTGAQSEASTLEAVAQGFDALGREFFTASRREGVILRYAVIAANPHLFEREAAKNREAVASLTVALVSRGADEGTARVAAELGALATSIARERWEQDGCQDDFASLARRALADVQRVAASFAVNAHGVAATGR